jgi:hypothetical protein
VTLEVYKPAPCVADMQLLLCALVSAGGFQELLVEAFDYYTWGTSDNTVSKKAQYVQCMQTLLAYPAMTKFHSVLQCQQ